MLHIPHKHLFNDIPISFYPQKYDRFMNVDLNSTLRTQTGLQQVNVTSINGGKAAG